MRRLPLIAWFSILLVAAAGAAPSSPTAEPMPNSPDSAPHSFRYPETRRAEVVDQYHGVEVADPYRWLEETESEETRLWIEAQNAVTRKYLDALPSRDRYRQRLTELWNYERFGLPHRYGDHYFFTHNDGLQDQSVLYTAPTLDAPRRVLIDPNTLSEDGTVALAGWAPTDDGRLVAYGLADGGSDWRTWHVRDVETGEDLQDTIEWVKFSGIAWLPDASGFYYGRYDQPAPGAELTGTNFNQQLYFHRLGTDQSEDVLVYERPDEREWGFRPQVTEDGRFLVITNWKGSEPQNQIFLRDLKEAEGEVRPLITGFDADYSFVGSDAETLYFLTDHEAPRRRLIAVQANEPQRDGWQEVIPQSDDTLESVSLVGERFFATYLKDARSLARVHALDGRPLEEIRLPGLGSVGGFGGRRDHTETFFSFTNYVNPSTIYHYDIASGQTSLWRQPDVAFDPEAFVTEQVFYASKDGTQIPMIVTHRRDLPRDGSQRALLYAYGGFNISLTPSFSPVVAAWLDAGGIYAVPNLRGGGEYGREWHEAGMREKKQNVFDDFIAAAEFLIEEDYTRPQRLGIRGGSNGGLLVGAVMTQRPDLFGACLPAVGVMDMLRFHLFTIGWAWVTEFGCSDDPEQCRNLLAYSPLHNLRPGTCYPATLVTTADRDDRVVPGHSFKFAAALQAAQGCDRPALIRIETRAGHGAGTPVSKQIDQYADLWAFLEANLKEE